MRICAQPFSINKTNKPDQLPSWYLVSDRGVFKNFKLDFEDIEIENIRTDFGTGKKLILRGNSDAGEDIKVEIELNVELYDDFPATAIMYAEFENTSSSEDIIINEVYSNCYQLDASNVDETLSSHHFYSFYGTDGRILRQREKILSADFNAVNFTGRPDSLEGLKMGNGGLPFVDIWTKETGIGIGHIEKKWKNLYLPIRVQKDGRVFIAVREIPNINMPDPYIMTPGDSCKTVKTFVNAHTGDFYSTAKVFSELMKRQGIDMQTPTTQNDYLPAWCSWNKYSTHGMASKKDIMLIEPILMRLPELRDLKINEVIFDAGWFNNQGDWMPNTHSLSFPNGEIDMIESIRRIQDSGFKVKLWISFLTADPWSEISGLHPEWMIQKPDGSFHLDRWSGYTMCPSLPQVQEFHYQLAERLVGKYGANGFKVDGMYVCPPCYNPAHNHKNPNESSEDFHMVFKAFYDAVKSLDSNTTIMACPCGAVCDYKSLPYVTETIAADPKSLKTVRRRAKLYRAIKGDNTPYSSDYIDIKKGNLKFPVSLANAVGIGAVPQAFYGRKPSKKAMEIYKGWLSIYSSEMICQAEYLNLYDMSFDEPETHVFRKVEGGQENYLLKCICKQNSAMR